MAKPIAFGTDGWRAIIADEYTFANVRRCASGVGQLVTRLGIGDRGVVVGYDLRFESEDFAVAAAEALAGVGVRAWLCARSEPTPVISHGVLQQRAAAGITITASHNPAVYNGFKVRSDYGGAAAPDTIADLEKIINALDPDTVPTVARKDAEQRGLIVPIHPADAYIAQIDRLVDLSAIRAAGFRVVVDAMYGAGQGWFPRLLGGGQIQVHEIDGERNPAFPGINPEPIPRNLQKLFDTVRERQASVGIATDGDADRLGVCDEHGNFIDQLRAYSLIAYYLLEVRGFRGPIVKTLSTSSMLDRLAEQYGVPIYETSVGFKYIAPKMLETNALIGGEESGGYAFRGHIPERDGILAGLYFLDLMARTGKTPSQLVELLFSRVGEHYYDRIDTHFPMSERSAIVARLQRAQPGELGGSPIARSLRDDGFKFVLENGSWLLIRFSGTEPIMRIYAEAGSPDKVQELLAEGRALAGV